MAVNIKTLSETVPITEFEHTLEPLWASDTGRANSGKFSGTLLGYFSKVKISFGKCTQAQMNSITSAFEVSTFQMTYPTKDGTTKTEYFYGTALSGKKKNWDGKYEPFTLDLTGVAKYR